MAETERCVLAHPHPDLEHGVPRQPLEYLLTPPDQGVNAETGLVMIVDGDGFTPATSYNTFLRRYLATRTNCLAVGVFYFGCRLNSLDFVRLRPNPGFFVNLQAAHGIAVSAPAELETDTLVRRLCRTLAGQGVTGLDPSCWLIRSFEDEYSSYGLLPALDHLQVIGALMQRFPLNRNRFYVIGSSSGGHIAMMMGKLAPHTFSMIVDNSGEVHNPMVRPTRRSFRRGRIAGVECRGLELSPWDEDPASPHCFSEHHRRIRDLAEEELTGPQADNRQDAPEDASLHGGKAQEHDEINESQEATDALDPELQEPLTDEARLNKLRKRGKRILIAMGDELERVVFMAMLHQDGYRCLFEAKSLVQALNHHRNIALDLLMVDHTIGHMNAVSFVDVLRDQGLPKSVPVVVMQRKIDHQLALAEKAGTLSYLVDHPVDFPGSLKQPLERLLGLAVPES